MINVISVRFRQAGKVYYFNPGEHQINTGDHVIVETARGTEYGYVVRGNHEVFDDKVVQPLKEVIRMANEEDTEHEAANKAAEKEAFKLCFEKIKKHELEMKLIDCEYTFDNSKILFYFTADGRIDFRDLVKDLAGVFRTRIELRQVGVRDETKILGGIGSCGRPLCCHTYLSDFAPVSIKMAKEQKLSLNPVKISGVCGRLMCCLNNEEEVYEELNKKLPNTGDRVTTPDGYTGEVQSVSILKQTVKVIVELPDDDKDVREYHADELKFKSRKKDHAGGKQEDPELKELEKLESLDKSENADKPEKSGRGERQERNDRQDRSEKADRAARSERPERAERFERQGRNGKADRAADRTDRPEKNGSNDRTDRNNRPDRSDRQGRPDRQDRSDKQGSNDRTDRKEQADRPERNGRQDRNEKPGRSDKGERADRSERNDRNDNAGADAQNRQARNGRPGKNDRQNHQDRYDKSEGQQGQQKNDRRGRGDRQRDRNIDVSSQENAAQNDKVQGGIPQDDRNRENTAYDGKIQESVPQDGRIQEYAAQEIKPDSTVKQETPETAEKQD